MRIKKMPFSLVVMLLISIIAPYSYAESNVDESISVTSEVKFTEECMISDRLAKRLNEASDNEEFLVTIRLRDSMSLGEVDVLARQRAGITVEQMQSYSARLSTMSNSEDIAFQQATVRDGFEKIRVARTEILVEYYQKNNAEIMESVGLSNAKYVSVSKLLPWVRGVELTKEQICRLVQSGQVCYIDCYSDTAIQDFASVEETVRIIGGHVAVNSGYVGSGIKVGLVETGHPILADMGTDATNITKTNGGTEKQHATQTSGLIIKMAPQCSVFSRAVTSSSGFVTCCEDLIENYNVQVINISAGYIGDGNYDATSRQMDELVQNYKVSIVVAAGNEENTHLVNQLGLAANVITVGAVTTVGTSPTAAGALTLAEYSCYKENVQAINKPDICAPGCVQIYSYGADEGTSFATPHVTGTIVQMLSANSALDDKPETIKAVLMASAFYNAGTDMTYVPRTRASNEEGAGVVNAHFCYNIARSGQFSRHGIGGPGTYSVNVSCNDISRPFRIVATWYVTSSEADESTSRLNIDINVYKNGQLVASSTAPGGPSSFQASTNYEIIQLEPSVIKTYGAGQYEVRISLAGSFSGMSPNYVGVAYGLCPTLLVN